GRDVAHTCSEMNARNVGPILRGGSNRLRFAGLRNDGTRQVIALPAQAECLEQTNLPSLQCRGAALARGRNARDPPEGCDARERRAIIDRWRLRKSLRRSGNDESKRRGWRSG